jgi:Effector-associated domain 11
MKEFEKKITDLIALGEIDGALTTLYNLLSVASSELKNDATILRGRFSKLNSDKRKGIISHDVEILEFNIISNASLELLTEMVNNAAQFDPYLKDMDDSMMRFSKTEIDLDESVKRKRLEVSSPQKISLWNRMAHIKDRNIKLKALWLDDSGTVIQCSEKRLIEAIGVELHICPDPDLAHQFLGNTPYDFIISDMKRGDDHKAGLTFLENLVAQGKWVPTIFYITQYNAAKGVPPYAFGITNRPNELLHLVMDVIERKA